MSNLGSFNVLQMGSFYVMLYSIEGCNFNPEGTELFAQRI